MVVDLAFSGTPVPYGVGVIDGGFGWLDTPLDMWHGGGCGVDEC